MGPPLAIYPRRVCFIWGRLGWCGVVISFGFGLLAACLPLCWRPGLVGLCFVTLVCLDVLWASELACSPLFARVP